MSFAQQRERRILKQIDIPPEIQQAFDWFLNNLTDAFQPVRDSLVAALEDGDINPAEETTIRAQVRQIVRGFRSDVVVVFTDGTERGANAGAELARRRYPIEISWDRPPQRVLDEFSEWSETAVDESLDTLTRDVADLIRGAQREGLSIPDIAAEVRQMTDDRYVSGNPWKSEQIARTGTISSSNAGRHAAYEDAESVGEKTWLATDDSRTRHAHREADGQTVGIDESFTVMGEDLRYPGDPTGSMKNIINCRCTVLPEIDT